jgi:hypothetical protein
MGSLNGAQRNPGLYRSEQLQARITLRQACPECTQGLRAIGCYSVADSYSKGAALCQFHNC